MHRISVLPSTELVYSQASDSVKLKFIQDLSFIFNVASVSNPAADDFLAGEVEISTMNFEDKADMDDGEYLVVYDTAGLAWAVAADLTGSSPEPTGAVWTAIPAARKTQADLSGVTNDEDVAAAFESAFDGLTGFSSVITTDDTAADGTMIFTQVVRGPASTPVSLLEDDAGPGGIAIAETNQGVAPELDLDANTITLAAHNFNLGQVVRGTSTGTLPAGLSTGVDYYVIVVDANTIKLATSLANAQAGTAINITDYGTDGATHTLTAEALAGATIKLQASNDNTNWVDVGSATNVTTTGNIMLEDNGVGYGWARVYFTITKGQVTGSIMFVGHEYE